MPTFIIQDQKQTAKPTIPYRSSSFLFLNILMVSTIPDVLMALLACLFPIRLNCYTGSKTKLTLSYFLHSSVYFFDYGPIEKDVKKFTQNKVNISNKIENAKLQIAKLENDIEEILMERIRDKENREIYNKMIEKRRVEITALSRKIDDLENIEETIKRRKANIKEEIDILDSIIAEQTISNANLRLLVKEIIIDETDGKMSIDINLNGTFLGEYSEYDENGNEEDLLKKYPGWEMTDELLKKFLQAG